jgi:hypothetical protein
MTTSNEPAGAQRNSHAPQTWSQPRRGFLAFMVWSMIGTVICTTGCARHIGTLMYLIKGRDLPAEYAELEGKRVAVVVNSESGSNMDATAIIMARAVHSLLEKNVEKVQMVNPEEVDHVVNDQPPGEKSMSRIGRQLEVDYVVFIEIKNMKVRDGVTLYRGTSDSFVAVYQVDKGDRSVFKKEFPSFVYPSTGMPSTDMDETSFRRMYLGILAARVARTFYKYDPNIDFGHDAAAINFGRM